MGKYYVYKLVRSEDYNQYTRTLLGETSAHKTEINQHDLLGEIHR